MSLRTIIFIIMFLVTGLVLGIGGVLFFNYWFEEEESQQYGPASPAFGHTVTPVGGKPFLLGFTSLERETFIDKLKVQGKIPSWIKGTFIAIGPGQFEINESKATHWLDGFAMIHRFNLNNGSVSYANKLIKSNYYEEAVKKGVMGGTTPDQKSSKWAKLRGALSSKSNRPVYDNVNVNVFALGSQLMALTETPHPLCVDCQTLETTKQAPFKEDSIQAHFSSGHPLFDPRTHEWYNIGIQYAMQSSYVVYKIDDRTKKRTQIASIKVDKPSYVHSFALTEHFIILTEVPLRVKPYDLLMAKKSFIETHHWNPRENTIFTVIDRHSGKIVSTFKTYSFFALHHINAFEMDDSIAVDIVTYKDPSIIKSLGFDHLYHADQHYFPTGTLERFTLDLRNHKVSSKVLSKKNIEMPQINYQKYGMHPYQYVYGVSLTSSKQLADQIVKINVKNGKDETWQCDGCYPSEPIFIASPHAKAEDDGVLLCVVLDTQTKQSLLLVLDAKNFKEIGRALVPHHIPFTVHSKFLAGSLR